MFRMGDLRRTFKPEFLNRVDDIIIFHQLTKDNIRQIASNMMQTVIDRTAQMGINMEIDDKALDILAEKGFDPIYGARPLRRTIQSSVEDAVAEKMLDGELKGGVTAIVSGSDGNITVSKKEEAM